MTLFLTLETTCDETAAAIITDSLDVLGAAVDILLERLGELLEIHVRFRHGLGLRARARAHVHRERAARPDRKQNRRRDPDDQPNAALFHVCSPSVYVSGARRRSPMTSNVLARTREASDCQ